MSKSTVSFLALSCVGAFATAPALADERPAADTAATMPDDQSRDVLVTGQRMQRSDDPKQVAPLIDTPRSVVVLPADVIQKTGSTTLEDALRTVPGITFGAAEGGNPIGDRPFIRGFDSQGSIDAAVHWIGEAARLGHDRFRGQMRDWLARAPEPLRHRGLAAC